MTTTQEGSTVTRMTTKPPDFKPGDIVYEPDNPTRRLYRVIEVLSDQGHRSLVHVMRPDGDESRWLPNHVDFMIERP